MKFTEPTVKQLCSGLMARYTSLIEDCRLNGGTAAAILGVSRSRYTQLAKPHDEFPMLQSHIFLNLLWANDRLKQGLDEGWLPAKSLKGAAQEQVLLKLESLAG